MVGPRQFLPERECAKRSVKIPEDRWNLAHDGAEAMAFATELRIESLVVRLFRREETLDERPVASQKTFRVGVPRITPMREETATVPGILPEKTSVL